MGVPSAFISYSWDDDEHKTWVRGLAARLRSDGVDVILDQWHAVPGDQLPQFMETAVRESHFVLIICTPRYNERSEGRIGGVGYEGDIITGEFITSGNQRKFIPILRRGNWKEAAPSWLVGKYHIDLRGSIYSERGYQDLLTTLHGTRAQAPPLGRPPAVRPSAHATESSPVGQEEVAPFQPIKIMGIIVDEVSVPRGDGTPRSALYNVPFRLSRRPPPEWAELFVQVWNHPPQFSSMHRPGIASIAGDRVVLDGTTVEEVERYHRDTLMVVLQEVNQRYQEHEMKRRQQEERERSRLRKHKENIADIAQRIKFDE